MVTPMRGLLSYLFIVAYLAASSVAQVFSSALSAPTTTPSAAVQTHTIDVGNGDHKFRPEVTQAEIGDIIEFHFFPPNHSVVRAEYEFPCIPYEMTGRGKVGFFSGFYPVDAILADPPKWTVTINDTDPIFFYCSAKGSCIDYQMVGVINPNASVSLEQQKRIAEKASYMLQPGEPFPAEGGPSTIQSATSTPSSTPSSTPFLAPTAATTPSTAAASASKPVLSIGAIVGIVIAGVAGLALAAALFFFIGRSKTLKQEMDRQNSTLPPQSPGVMHQRHSFLPPKGDVMTSPSSRNSAAVVPASVQYDNYGRDTAELKAPEYFYHGAGAEDAYLRSATASPGSDRGHGRTSTVTSSGIPLRHPSVLLNPNSPREMDAPDGRYLS